MSHGNFIRYEHKFGFISDLGTDEKAIDGTSQETYPYLSVATTVTVSSSNVNDTAAGDGARTVHLFGLDANYDEVDEIISMNGQTGVFSVNEYLRVFRLHVITAGVDQDNDGEIYIGTGTITDGVPAVELLHMHTDDGATLHGGYTIPRGQEGRVTALILTSGRLTGNTQSIVSVRLRERDINGIFRTRFKQQLISAAIEFQIPSGSLIFPAKADYEPRAVSSATNTLVGITTIIELWTANDV